MLDRPKKIKKKKKAGNSSQLVLCVLLDVTHQHQTTRERFGFLVGAARKEQIKQGTDHFVLCVRVLLGVPFQNFRFKTFSLSMVHFLGLFKNEKNWAFASQRKKIQTQHQTRHPTTRGSTHRDDYLRRTKVLLLWFLYIMMMQLR